MVSLPTIFSHSQESRKAAHEMSLISIRVARELGFRVSQACYGGALYLDVSNQGVAQQNTNFNISHSTRVMG